MRKRDETRQEMGQEKRQEEKVQEGKRRDEMHTQNHILPLVLSFSLMCFIGMISNCALVLPKH